MNRPIQVSSPVARAFAWFLLVALFCDTANLDDLISTTPVLHDDDEVVASSLGNCPGGFVTGSSQPDASREPAVSQSVQWSRVLLRVCVDQDSPSLPANEPYIKSQSLFCRFDDVLHSPAVDLPAQQLHILFRSLLI